MKINWKIRFKNPVFLIQLALALVLPILAYAGLSFQDLTSWAVLWGVVKNALGNPYVLGLAAVSVWNAINDPTTAGLCDSMRALGYDCVNESAKQE